MAMTLDKVVPFGRSFDEYRRMFSLGERELASRILGVGDGPASFNAELTAKGGRVVSVDPVYAFAAAEIQSQFDTVVDDIIAQVRASLDDWVWTYHASPEALHQHRIDVLERFIADYDEGKASGRYCIDELPALGFPDRSFDLALCSHFLFLYSEQLSCDFHLVAIREMLRVANEVRVFPVIDLMRRPSPHITALQAELEKEGIAVTLETVDYEFQKGGNQMLVIR